MFDIIAMGSNTIDIFAHTDKGQLINIRSAESNSEFISYPVGSKILVTQLMHNFGGNGANAAVAFSRLGLRTGYIGKVGRDPTGAQIISELRKNKVTFIGTRGDASGTSIVLDANGEDRTILGFKGCNNDLKASEIRPRHSKWLYISSMLGESLKTMMIIAKRARKDETCIAFNPSQTIIDAEREAALELAKLSDVIVLNKEESQSLVGAGSVEENLRKLIALGPKVAAITDGRNGASAFKDGTCYRIFPRKDIRIVETTGAGDAFAATLTAGLILKKPFEFCLKLAIIQAENVIQGHGAQSNLMEKNKLFRMALKDTRAITKKSMA
jgi:ribokinase